MPDEAHGSLTIHRGSSGLTADCDLYATRSGELVKGDNPEANTLVARKGMAIPDDIAERFNIKEMKGSASKEKDSEPAKQTTAPPAAKKD